MLAEPTSVSPSVTAICRDWKGAGSWSSIRVTVRAWAVVAVNENSEAAATPGAATMSASSSSAPACANPTQHAQPQTTARPRLAIRRCITLPYIRLGFRRGSHYHGPRVLHYHGPVVPAPPHDIFPRREREMRPVRRRHLGRSGAG